MRIRRTSAAFALVTAALVLGAQLAETAHVESEHVVCPEHGELIHASASAGGGPNEADAVSGLESHEAHEAHCAHAFAAQHITSRPGLSAIVEATPDLAREGPHASRAPIALLRLAPKSSPPVIV